MEEMADLSDNSSSSHRQNGKTMEAVEYREDVGIPEDIRILVEEFEAESLEMKNKIHRLPVSLAGMEAQFVIPTALAIGPYHHGLPHLEGMEKAKRVAAYSFTKDSGHSYKEMYGQVLAVAEQARRLYAADAVSGIKPDEFADMMFHDACFLLQYMNYMESYSCDEEAMLSLPLQRFFVSNLSCINNDIMLLENQLPWLVIEALMTTMEVDVGAFIALMGRSMMPNNLLPFDFFENVNTAPSDRPPHLLGLLRLHKQRVPVYKPPRDVLSIMQYSIPIRAKELEGNGIKLEQSKTDNFTDIGIRKGLFFDKLFLPPLNLDRTTASWLTNMVAFEVCMALPDFGNNDETPVCSYVAVLAMLMVQEEDVHMLRSKGFLEGELSDKQIIAFFNQLAQQMILGSNYVNILAGIGGCKKRRWLRITVCKFVSNNAKAIAAVLSIIGVLVGIFKALYSLKQH